MKKKRAIVKGKVIEINVQQTAKGDYIAYANFPGCFGMAVGRDEKKEVARKMCIERLFSNEEMLKNNTLS